MSDSEQESWFEEGCWITELANSADDPALSVARARVESGGTTRWHQLKGTIERYLVLSGSGVVEVGAQPPRLVGPHDWVYIPANTRQRIRNSGEQDLVFLALCTPRFQRSNYQDLE